VACGAWQLGHGQRLRPGLAVAGYGDWRTLWFVVPIIKTYYDKLPLAYYAVLDPRQPDSKGGPNVSESQPVVAAAVQIARSESPSPRVFSTRLQDPLTSWSASAPARVSKPLPLASAHRNLLADQMALSS
jgi:hypothetical protein